MKISMVGRGLRKREVRGFTVAPVHTIFHCGLFSSDFALLLASAPPLGRPSSPATEPSPNGDQTAHGRTASAL
eukprot:scaffold159671_cov34-Tisochrysis_lutea.AAC.4